MSFTSKLDNALRELVIQDDCPVVVSAAMWPVLKAMGRKDAAAVDEVLDLLIDRFAGRGLLMPSFTNGFDVGGTCDLDHLPGTTGILSEAMRRRPGTVRTLSAWFSYLVLGPCAQEAAGFLPNEAWGEGSLYEWMEKQNVCFLMLGTHPTHCSYLHRLEWLARDKLSYRFNKTFNGVLIRNDQEFRVHETLYVRSLKPVEAINDFTNLMPFLYDAGMNEMSVDGVSLAVYKVRAIRDAILPALQADPYLVLRNREPFLCEEKK